MSIRPLRRAIAGVAIAVMTAAGLAAVDAQTASAVSSCTLKATLPSKVVINKADVAFYATLSGSGNCKPAGGEFDEADAYFDGPNGIEDLPYWEGIGQKYRFDFYAFEGHPGSYALRDGEALIWTADYDQVPVHWTATKTIIRYGSKISIATKRSGHKVTVSGTASKYTTDQAYKPYGSYVYLQRKAKSAHVYHGFKTLKANSTGKVSYSYSTTSKYDYRFVIKDASGVWGSTSAVSYR